MHRCLGFDKSSKSSWPRAPWNPGSDGLHDDTGSMKAIRSYQAPRAIHSRCDTRTPNWVITHTQQLTAAKRVQIVVPVRYGGRHQQRCSVGVAKGQGGSLQVQGQGHTKHRAVASVLGKGNLMWC